MIGKITWFLLGSLLIFLTACGVMNTGQKTTPESAYPASTPLDGEPVMGDAQWPTDLPADVPQLSGEMRSCMGSVDTKYRIFYAPLSDAQVDQFLTQCRDAGFSIRYLVYLEDGSYSETAQATDFDAVEMTRSDLRMRLEYGSDNAVLDIYPAGVMPGSAPTTHPWPVEDPPQPEGCGVRDVASLAGGGYQIACAYADGDLHLETYLQTLSGLGYAESERQISDTDEIVYILMQSDAVSVKLMPHALSGTLTLQVSFP